MDPPFGVRGQGTGALAWAKQFKLPASQPYCPATPRESCGAARPAGRHSMYPEPPQRLLQVGRYWNPSSGVCPDQVQGSLYLAPLNSKQLNSESHLDDWASQPKPDELVNLELWLLAQFHIYHKRPIQSPDYDAPSPFRMVLPGLPDRKLRHLNPSAWGRGGGGCLLWRGCSTLLRRTYIECTTTWHEYRMKVLVQTS